MQTMNFIDNFAATTFLICKILLKTSIFPHFVAKLTHFSIPIYSKL